MKFDTIVYSDSCNIDNSNNCITRCDVDSDSLIVIPWCLQTEKMAEKLIALDNDILILDIYGVLQNVLDEIHNKEYKFYVYTDIYIRNKNLIEIDDIDKFLQRYDDSVFYLDYIAQRSIDFNNIESDCFRYYCDTLYEQEMCIVLNKIQKFINTFHSNTVQIILEDIWFFTENFDIRFLLDFFETNLQCDIVAMYGMYNKDIEMLSYKNKDEY